MGKAVMSYRKREHKLKPKPKTTQMSMEHTKLHVECCIKLELQQICGYRCAAKSCEGSGEKAANRSYAFVFMVI